MKLKATGFFFWVTALLVAGCTSGIAAGHPACTNATLRGRYAFKESGTVVDPAGVTVPVAIAGVFTSDGAGNLVAADTVSTGGQIQQEQLSFTYQVHPDCTGSASTPASTPPEQQIHFNFVIIGNGREAVGIQTDPGTTLLLSAKKQFPRSQAPGPPENGQQ
jgi:hypothetical protein